MKFTKYLWMGSLMAAMPVVLCAASNRWTRVGPDGAAIIQIAINPADEAGAWVLTNGAGIFKTTNAGASWREANDGLPLVSNVSALLVLPDEAATLYAALESDVYISHDGAEHWSMQGNVEGDRISAFAFDPISRTLYAATNGKAGVYRSTDGGKTWAVSLQSMTEVISSLAISRNGTVYAERTIQGYPFGTLTELMRSSDQGGTWAYVAQSPVPARTIAIDPERSTLYVLSGSDVYVSKDDASTWSKLPAISARVNSIVPVGGGQIYVGTDHGVYEYGDRSGVWTSVSTAISGAAINLLAISASRPLRFYAAKDVGLLTSVENGTDWNAADKGLPAKATDVAVEQSDPAVVYVATSPGLFKSAADGESWQQLSEAGPIKCLALDPRAHDTLYAGALSSSAGRVVKTIDAGATWTTVNPNFASVLAAAPSDPATIYAALIRGMWKSTNAGDSWTSITAGLPFYTYYLYTSIPDTASIAVDPKDSSRLYVAESWGGMFGSVNGGTTWTSVSDKTAQTLAIDPLDPRIIYAGLKVGGVIKTLNSGLTWGPAGLTDESVTTLAIDPTNSAVIYAGTSTGSIHRSTNGGVNWISFDAGLPPAHISKIAMNASGRKLYSATTAGLFGYERDESYLEQATRYKVSFMTYNKNFVSAADCGDGSVNSNAVSDGPCETFTLYVVNPFGFPEGSALINGASVYLQAANGSFVSAENGGANGCGGCESPLNANRLVAMSWETFTIRKVNGSGLISKGDAITLQSSSGNYVTAEYGGGNGCHCDAPVTATRVFPRAWETFVLSIH